MTAGTNSTSQESYSGPLDAARSLLPAIIFVFAATTVFSFSFVLPYKWQGINTRWGLVIGAAAALTWPFFIGLLSVVARISLLESLQVCVRTMFWGNLVLLLTAVLNLAGYLAQWSPPLAYHLAIVALANLVMFGRFSALCRGLLSFPQTLVLWFAALNGFFAGVVVLAYRTFIQ